MGFLRRRDDDGGEDRDRMDKGQRQRQDIRRGSPAWKDCGPCGGTGKILKDVGGTDEDGTFNETKKLNCTSCNGTGRLPIKDD
ncbi:hypothetical protein [Protofrankia symbiont of Coriaria ruscifolia]|uniref:Uncharacterized protein n=1 Tax=Candidatus Protofrankia californiensis TaxID=1839754 RepID=A0A1C3NUN6_9ACTN|nr:hypothetical protein [Protofrankia symbiont of Coriaria ruscifolia]SBW19109.1 hypothetical protein FDG2_0960 [Candidatus Protofrankia californiensis]